MYTVKDGKLFIGNSLYDDIGGISPDYPLIPVKRGNRWGYIDKKGREIIPPMYKQAYPPSCGYVLVEDETHFWFLDYNGRIRFGPYLDARPFIKGFAAIKAANINWGVLSRNGIVLYGYDNIHIDYPYLYLGVGVKWKLARIENQNIKIIVDTPHDSITIYEEMGLVLVRDAWIHVFVDIKTGKVVSPLFYDVSIRNGIIRVKTHPQQDGWYIADPSDLYKVTQKSQPRPII